MTQIRITSFCEKFGFSPHQIRHAIRSGKLSKITNGIIDEEQALQALENTLPKRKEVIALQNEITELKKQLQKTLDLKNYYEAELNKIGIFPVQIAKIQLQPEAMKNSSENQTLSQKLTKQQIEQTPESERMFKARKVPIPPEAFSSSLPYKK